jgi:rubrerythrin
MAEQKKSFMTLTEVIEKAIVFEESSAVFYHGMRREAPSENVRELLETLETEELEHKRILKDGLAKENELAKRSGHTEEYIQFPPEMSLLMPPMKKEKPTFEELLDYAIEREVQSALIYETTGLTSPSRIKDWFIELSRFERNHEVRLRDLKNL